MEKYLYNLVIVNHAMRIVVALLLWYLQYSYEETLEESDNCTLPTGEKGICINIHNCGYAKKLLENRQNPGICGFKRNDPLVCCIRENSQLRRKPGELSAKKCQEYYPYKRYFIIIGAAKPSLVKEFPHMAVIGYGDINNKQWLCGGSLISYNFVLTAAHCLKSQQVGEAKFVRLGDLDLSTDTDEASPQDFTVKRLIPHPEYKRPSRYHDIGLIELDRNVTITQFVGMACLDTRREHNESVMTVIGWGRTAFTGPTSSFLLKADFDIVPHRLCKGKYSRIDPELLPNGIIDDFHICAGGTKEQDTCEGDSGGPLQIENQERTSSIRVYDIVGITSFGKACGVSDAPGVYTRVYNYLSWIEQVVWPNS